ncbi:hypothetical protein MAXJ12_20282 [Mesorhizobium alhagi CCNWXJ12-2]|uniref:Uncharacterized protein n=1 Tax=Mesorhizobium alhagi CCNWXJ12-2 TaxID=1107882 RepID=H0HV53_9HYPH|nr:hypothetical protein MAXJ12_20282 [Mesorhizobium alhagi CCNWXJ12-2]
MLLGGRDLAGCAIDAEFHLAQGLAPGDVRHTYMGWHAALLSLTTLRAATLLG